MRGWPVTVRGLAARAVGAGLAVALVAACSARPVSPPAAPPAPPAPPPAAPGAPVEPSKLVVAVDDFGAGFNPHLLADQSPTTTALAALVLPSVFRPDASGALQLDRTVVTSATVTSTDPFTVSYEIDLRASWSSNAPIAAEDFVYLWERMRSEPGVSDAAGYRLITDVRSRAGGKAVDVVFAEPYPAWQRLFTNLLPAHILKDAPGSWVGALAGGLPASGGPFRIVSVDRGRGEIVLGRNDLYWATPTVLDQLVLRRLDRAALPGAFAAGDIDVALTVGWRQQREALAAVAPPLRLQSAPQPIVTGLTMRVDDGPLADAGVRRAVATMIDREAVRGVVAPEALPVDAFGLAPSEPGYAPTAPPRPEPAEVEGLLGAAGWVRAASGRWTVDGAPVRLAVAAAADRADDVRIAKLVAAQLDAAGIDATVVTPSAVELFAQPTVPLTPLTTSSALPSPAPVASAELPPNAPGPAGDRGAPTPTAPPRPTPAPLPAPPGGGVQADLAVLSRTIGGDPGSELAGDFVCPPATVLVPDPPALPVGSCVSSLRPLFNALLVRTGGDELRGLTERELWRQLPALPLFEPVTMVVSTPAADAATGIGAGPLDTGPLTGAQRWTEPAG